MSQEFFPPRPQAQPTVYAYELVGVESHNGLIKVGYTTRNAQDRVAEQLKTARVEYKILLAESAMRNDGSAFTDHDVHRYLRSKGYKNPEGEWFRCTLADVQAAIVALKTGKTTEGTRTQTFPLRPEQAAAIEKTSAYFTKFKAENLDRTPHFLWNAKMRFGKTFATYQLAKKMGWKKILVLTFKPAAWEEDLAAHVDFDCWQFISRNSELTIDEADKSHPIVCFGSFQDYLAKTVWA